MINVFKTEEAQEKVRLSTEIDKIFALQRGNLQKLAMQRSGERAARLKTLQKTILKRRKRIYNALHEDFRKPATEVEMTEIYPVISEIRHTAGNLKNWMAPQKVSNNRGMTGSRAWMQSEPKGMVLIIAPGSFPFQYAMKPLVSALAAGNAVIIKPAGSAPQTADLIYEIAGELFDENEVAVFRGSGDVASELLKKPFNHIFFTGSTEAGKSVMKRAAGIPADCTLKLGGKSPVIIDESADIEHAARKIAWGKFLNAGQSCIAPDYVIVHESHRYDLKFHLKEYVEKSYSPENRPVQESPDYARMITEEHFRRVKRLLDQAAQDGATLVFGGECQEGELFIAPTVLRDVAQDSAIMQEEIFGPVLPLFFYSNIGDAIGIIRDRPTPPALYIFSRDEANIRFILENADSGEVAVNDVLLQHQHLNLPAGGKNESGIGSQNGIYGYRTFSHQRSVMKESPRMSRSKLLYPPFSRTSNQMVKWLTKFF